MTIAERINLHKCGYSKEEIAALIAEEKEEHTIEEPASTVEEPTPKVKPENSEILAAINNLTAAIQAQNLQRAEQNTPAKQTAEDVLNGALKNL